MKKTELLQFYIKHKTVINLTIILLLGYFSGMLQNNI